MPRDLPHILIIGGGFGGALAHDLALRGFRVTLVEKGEILSGTTGRHHGLLHSGARYAVHDPAAARECIVENRILRQIAPQALEVNDGLFVALTDGDMAYLPEFRAACRDCGIPAAELTAAQARALVPGLHPQIKGAVRVPDGTMDAWRLPLHFFASARANGALIRPFTEVTDILVADRTVKGLTVRDHRLEKNVDIHGDLVVNAAGPWAGRVAAMAGLAVPVKPGPGVMVAVEGRLTPMVINRLHPAGEGDIIVPQRGLSVLGTSIWLADDPDAVDLPQEHVRRMIDLCAQMMPEVQHAPVRAAWCAARPLLEGAPDEDPYRISRTFDCIDHEVRDQVRGMLSVVGGKATTLRAMAEETADLICSKFGLDLPCRTRSMPLLPPRRYYG